MHFSFFLQIVATIFLVQLAACNFHNFNATKLQVCKSESLWIELWPAEKSGLANRIEWRASSARDQLVTGNQLPTVSHDGLQTGRQQATTPASLLCAGRSQKKKIGYIYIRVYIGKVTVTLPSEPATCLASSFYFSQNIFKIVLELYGILDTLRIKLLRIKIIIIHS